MTSPASVRHNFIGRALAVWLVLIAVEFVHGILRAIFLVPYVGDFRSRQIGVFIRSALILVIAYLFFGWLCASNKKLLMVGLMLMALDCFGIR